MSLEPFGPTRIGPLPPKIVFRLVRKQRAHAHFEARLPHPDMDVAVTLSNEPGERADETHVAVRMGERGKRNGSSIEIGRYLVSGRRTAASTGEVNDQLPSAAQILQNQSRRADPVGEFMRAALHRFELHPEDHEAGAEEWHKAMARLRKVYGLKPD